MHCKGQRQSLCLGVVAAEGWAIAFLQLAGTPAEGHAHLQCQEDDADTHAGSGGPVGIYAQIDVLGGGIACTEREGEGVGGRRQSALGGYPSLQKLLYATNSLRWCSQTV